MIEPATESDPTASPAGIDRSDWYVVAFLIACWGLIEVVINPVGDFPLNDDWAYGLPVKWLVEEGRLRFTEQFATLFTHVIWGSLFASLAGFSFTVLRISTIVIAAVGLVATYLAGREAGLSRAVAAMVVGLFVINPVFVNLVNSFMTDVPFLSLMMLSVLLFLRGLKYDHMASLWAGWAVVLAAALLRQVAIAIPIGLMVAMAIKDGMNRAWLLRAVLPSAVVLAVVLAYPRVLEATIGLPPNYHWPTNNLKAVLNHLAHLRLGATRPIIRGVGGGALCLGLWMLPLLAFFWPCWIDATDRRGLSIRLAVVAVTAAAVTAILWFAEMLMPLNVGGNILIDLGTGPQNLKGQRPHAPPWLWVAITGAAALGATSIVLALGQVARRALARIRSGQGCRSLWLPAFLLVSLVFYYAPFCAQYGPWFDRYVLPMMGLIALLLMGEPIGVIVRTPPILGVQGLVSTALAVLYLAFAVASTHDYLAWNRQLWAAAESLMAQGATAPDDIQGGYAFNEYYAWRDLPRDAIIEASVLRGGESKDRARYAIAFGELPGFSQVRRLSVDRWLPLSPDQIVVLERRGNMGPVGRGDPSRSSPHAGRE